MTGIVLGAASLLVLSLSLSQYVDASAPNNYVKLQPNPPGTAQAGNANVQGQMTAGLYAGNGVGLTNLRSGPYEASAQNLWCIGPTQGIDIQFQVDVSGRTWVMTGIIEQWSNLEKFVNGNWVWLSGNAPRVEPGIVLTPGTYRLNDNGGAGFSSNHLLWGYYAYSSSQPQYSSDYYLPSDRVWSRLSEFDGASTFTVPQSGIYMLTWADQSVYRHTGGQWVRYGPSQYAVVAGLAPPGIPLPPGEYSTTDDGTRTHMAGYIARP